MKITYDIIEIGSVCEECRYFSWDEDGVGHCAEGVDDGTDWSNYQVASGDVVESDFGCNKFKEKDES